MGLKIDNEIGYAIINAWKVEIMDNRKVKKINKKSRARKKKSRFATFLAIISIAIGLVLSGQTFILGLLEMKTALLVFGIVLILPLLFLWLHMIFSNISACRILFSVLIICVGVAYGFGNYMVYKANKTLDVVTQLTNKTTHKINLISLQSSGISSLEQLEGQKVGISSVLDEKGNQEELEHIQGNVNVEVVDYDNLETLLLGLLNEEVSAIVLNEVYRGYAQEMGDEFNKVNTNANVLDQVKYYTESDKTLVEPDRVNVTSKPFTVLVSGNDSYGTLEETSRSDVNMLLTVNPNTNTVLVTNVSRDSYVSIACGADADSTCGEGAMDKLTHTGLDGVATTEKTIENLLGITINYNVRVNFSSFSNIVDAVGGIDVYVEEGCEVDSFYTNGTQGVVAGWNHLDGARALGFVRERYAYIDGTAQRVRNQQEAIRALVNKVCSISTVKNFNDIIDALDSAFETNMNSNEIKSFIRYQFSHFPTWTFEGYSLRYDSSVEFCYALQTNAYVDLVQQDSVSYAKQKIQAVLDGKSSTTIEDPEEAGVAGSYSSEDQAAIINEGEMGKGYY